MYRYKNHIIYIYNMFQISVGPLAVLAVEVCHDVRLPVQNVDSSVATPFPTGIGTMGVSDDKFPFLGASLAPGWDRLGMQNNSKHNVNYSSLSYHNHKLYTTCQS